METKTTNTALLVMDMQDAVLKMLPGAPAIVTKVAEAVAHARKNNIPVIYVVLAFRPGQPEIGPDNKSFFAMKDMMAGADMKEWSGVGKELAPTGDEVVVEKRRVSAFSGSDLEVMLRVKGIKQMVLTGIATSGVVLSTTREAADKDYRLTILSDCCMDRDEEVHRVLMTKVFPRQADVMTVEEWSRR